MSNVLIGLAIAMILFGGWLGWTWFVRYFQGRIDEPQNVESAAILLLWGGAIFVMLAAGFAFELLSWLGWL